MRLSSESRIIIYGAGYCGLHFCELLQASSIKPICVVDQNPDKWGEFMGCTICGVEESLDKSALVIVCVLDKGGLFPLIQVQLNEKGFDRVVHIFDISTDNENKFIFNKQNLILFPDKVVLEGYKERIASIGRRLDEKGKHVYDQIVSSLESSFQSEIQHIDISNQYWDLDVYSVEEKEVVLDVGAFDGTVMEWFYGLNKSPQAYYAIEPVRGNYKKLLERTKRYRNCKAILLALSDKDEEVELRDYLGSNAVICIGGGDSAQAITGNEFVSRMGCLSPTIVKIDVEGYEKKVLSGLAEIIKRCEPVIACAFYHSIDELIEIPEYLIRLLESKDYRYTVRSYMNVNESIFYAIPSKRCS